MLLKLALLCSVLLVFLLVSCHKDRPSEQSLSAQLTGTWELQIGHDCQDYPLQSDMMVLHSDGTFDQHTVIKDGRRVDSMAQRWAYMDKDSVSLDKRRDWDTHSDPSLSKPENRTNSNSEGKAELQVLIVRFSSPPVILINPDSDCVYVKAAGKP